MNSCWKKKGDDRGRKDQVRLSRTAEMALLFLAVAAHMLGEMHLNDKELDTDIRFCCDAEMNGRQIA